MLSVRDRAAGEDRRHGASGKRNATAGGSSFCSPFLKRAGVEAGFKILPGPLLRFIHRFSTGPAFVISAQAEIRPS
jgi:hypothetical protein